MKRFNNLLKGFSLLELIVVIVIIGILATLGLSQYYTARENALDKEAIASLQLIKAAERTFRLENGTYVNCADNTAVNTNLKLFLTAGSSRKWDYKVVDATAVALTAKAKRVGNPARRWCINQTTEEAYSAGCVW